MRFDTCDSSVMAGATKMKAFVNSNETLEETGKKKAGAREVEMMKQVHGCRRESNIEMDRKQTRNQWCCLSTEIVCDPVSLYM